MDRNSLPTGSRAIVGLWSIIISIPNQIWHSRIPWEGLHCGPARVRSLTPLLWKSTPAPSSQPPPIDKRQCMELIKYACLASMLRPLGGLRARSLPHPFHLPPPPPAGGITGCPTLADFNVPQVYGGVTPPGDVSVCAYFGGIFANHFTCRLSVPSAAGFIVF